MSVAMHRLAAPALLALALGACASNAPAPVEVGHPAHSNTAAAPPATLTILQSYRDFGASPAAGQGQQSPQTPATEKHDAHEH